MKKFVGGLLVLAFASPVFATSIKPPVALTENNLAVNAFLSLQASGKDTDLQKQIDHLKKHRYTRPGTTEAVLLGGQCGFAGCDATYLATSAYSTSGANTSSAVVAAVVYVNSHRRVAEVRRVLTEKEIELLVRR